MKQEQLFFPSKKTIQKWRNALDKNTLEKIVTYQLNAFNSYLNFPLPTSKDTDWQFITMPVIDWDSLEVTAHKIAPMYFDQGVIYTTLENFIENYPNVAHKTFLFSESLAQKRMLTSLIDSSCSQVAVLYVPKGVRCDDQINIKRIVDSAFSIAIEKLIIIVEQDSYLKFCDELVLMHVDSVLLRSIECWLMPNAKMDFVHYQDFSDSVTLFSHVDFYLDCSSELNYNFFYTGALFAANWINVVLNGIGSQVNIAGAYALSGVQKMVLNACIKNNAPHTSSHMKVKGALRDDAHAVYHATNFLAEQAKHAVAHQENKNILLSNRARVHSIPKLSVLNNEVQCGHGSAIGQMDEELLFYVKSRGIQKIEAQKLLLSGFFVDVLEDSIIKNYSSIMHKINQKLFS